MDCRGFLSHVVSRWWFVNDRSDHFNCFFAKKSIETYHQIGSPKGSFKRSDVLSRGSC